MSSRYTVVKARLAIADIDRAYYADHALTLVRHPSETDERVMVRLLAFMRHASERLAFAGGLSCEDEPEIWSRDLTGAIETWIEVGLPDPKRLRQAAGRAGRVCVYSYGGRAAKAWWDKEQGRLQLIPNLEVSEVPMDLSRSLSSLFARNMTIHCTVQEGQMWVADSQTSLPVTWLLRQVVTEES